MSPTSSSNGLRAVTFDCWNTLLVESDWVCAHGLRVSALEQAAQRAGRTVSRDRVSDAFDAAWARHMELWESGVASGALEVARWACEELGLPPSGPAFDALLTSFEEASHSSEVSSLAGARETLSSLAASGIRLGLICDTGLTPGRVVREHLDRLGLLVSLDVTIFSDEWSRTKPDPTLFRAALEALGSPPEAAAHVGDLRRTDVAGARAAGMRSVRIRAAHDDRTGHAEADVVVASHDELRAWVGV